MSGLLFGRTAAGKMVELAVNTDGTLRLPPILAMQSGVNAVPLGGGPGWVSGNIANLAIGGNANVIFDLGPNWDQYNEVAVDFNPGNGTSTGIVVQGDFSRDGATYLRGGLANGATGNSAAFSGPLSGANGPQLCRWRNQGRYVRVNISGIATAALGAAAAITLTAHPTT